MGVVGIVGVGLGVVGSFVGVAVVVIVESTVKRRADLPAGWSALKRSAVEVGVSSVGIGSVVGVGVPIVAVGMSSLPLVGDVGVGVSIVVARSIVVGDRRRSLDVIKESVVGVSVVGVVGVVLMSAWKSCGGSMVGRPPIRHKLLVVA